MPGPYIYIWEYTVREEHVQQFVTTYGPDGDWVRLFREASGYVGTELLRDRENPNRFVTIDRWESHESFERFRTDKSMEYEALDARCDRLTLEERQIGVFGGSED